MASKVNTKFVIALIIGLVVVCGGLALMGLYSYKRSGDRLIREGDKFYAAAEYKKASDKYSRAVAKDNSRVDWMEKWLGALTKTVPATQAEYNEAYSRHYLSVLTKMAMMRSTEPERQLPLIIELDRRASMLPGGRTVSALQSQITTIDDRLQRLDEANDTTKLIKGYRGLAKLDEMQRFPVDQAKRDDALRDLELGASVAKDNPRFQLAIVDWYESEIERYMRRENRPDEVERLMLREKLAEERAELVENFGSQPAVMVHEFRSEAIRAMSNALTPDAARQARAGLHDPALQLLARLEQVPADQISTDDFLTAAVVISDFLNTRNDMQSVEMVAAWSEKVLQTRPEDPRALIATARLQRTARNYARAYELFDRCVALPDVPVSLEGLLLPSYRRLAAGERVDTALLQRNQAEDPAEKEKFLAVAQEQRDSLKKLVDVGSEWELDLRDARIAMEVQDYRKAIALYEKLRAQGQQDNPEILGPLADALTRSGSEGMARAIYERMLASGQESLGVLARLADIEIGMNNLEKAESLLERAQLLDPANEFVRSRLENIRSVREAGGELDANQTTNPVLVRAIEAKRAREDGNLPLARQKLREAMDLSPGDARLVRMAVGVELAAGDRAAALALVDEALAVRADDAELRAMKTQLEVDDPVEAAKQIIATSGDSPVVKALSMYVVYAQQASKHARDEAKLKEFTALADAAFAEAEKLDPDYPGVIEIGFNRALREGKNDGFAKATQYVERAARTNADQRDGLTFQGRLELAKGDKVAAEQTLKRAVDRMEFDPKAWRWLGMAQNSQGKVDLAMASYERAYKGDEKDVTIALEYAAMLAMTGQGPKALTVLSPETGVLRFGDRTPAVVNFWLEMEAAHGDVAKALDARRKVYESDPADGTNTRQYLVLLIEQEDFETASTVLEAMDASDKFAANEVAAGRARVLAAQGKVAEGRALMRAQADSVPEAERKPETYLLMGAFEREFGTPQDALAAFEAGRPFQDPKIRELDRAAGDLLFSMAERASGEARTATDDAVAAQKAAESRDLFAKAEERYAAIAAADSEAVDVKKRHAETLIRLERFDEAMAALKGVGNENDMQVLLLRETMATRRGDERGAREAIDKAVELFPNEPLPFFRRAVLNAGKAEMRQDVMKDLEQAVRLRPGFIEAWQLRVALLARPYMLNGQEQPGNMNEAIAQLSRAVEANPANDELILYYINVLSRAGRKDEAQKVSYDVAMSRETDTEWLRRAAILAYDNEDYRRAEELYKKVWDITKETGPAMDLLNCYLRRENPPPTRAEVNRILPSIMENTDDLTPGGKMLLARAREFLEERAEAEKWTVEAYKAARGNAYDVRLWFENVVLRFGKDREKAFEYVLKKKEFQPLPPAIQLIVLRRDVDKGKPMASALEELNQMEEACRESNFSRVEFLRLRNAFHYSQGMYADSAEDCRLGLEIAPRDLEFNNNLAYILAKHLGKPQEALEPAKLAAALAPSDPAVLDTLGWVYFQAGQFRDADREFERAVATSRTPDDRVPAYLHHAQSKKAVGDRAEAQRLIGLAKQNLDQASETIRNVYAQEIEDLFTELNSGT